MCQIIDQLLTQMDQIAQLNSDNKKPLNIQINWKPKDDFQLIHNLNLGIGLIKNRTLNKKKAVVRDCVLPEKY